MKKLFALILAVVMMFVLMACGRDNDSATTGANTYPASNTTETTEACRKQLRAPQREMLRQIQLPLTQHRAPPSQLQIPFKHNS